MRAPLRAIACIALVACTGGGTGEVSPSIPGGASSPPTPAPSSPGGHQPQPGPAITVRGVTAELCTGCLRLARTAHLHLESIVRRSLTRITGLLTHLRTSVAISLNVGRAPPSGVSGWTDQRKGRVHISLHSRVADVAQEIGVWLPFTLAHELDHADRILHGPGIGHTLLDWLVAEGMADAFAGQAFPTIPPTLGDHALSTGQTRALWSKARPLLGERQGPNDFHAWFYGSVSGSIPSWTGYTLGYDIVTSYLAVHPGTSPVDLIVMPAARIYAESGFNP